MSPKELRTKRIDLGWTAQQLADKCSVPVGKVLDWEEGKAEIDCEELLRTVFEAVSQPSIG